MSEQRYTLHLYRGSERIRFRSPKFKNRKAAMKWLDSQGVEPLGLTHSSPWIIRRIIPRWGLMYEWMIGCKFKLVPIIR